MTEQLLGRPRPVFAWNSVVDSANLTATFTSTLEGTIMKNIARIARLLGLITGIGCTSAAAAVGPYTITDLGTLGGMQAGAYDVNASGQVTGYATIPGDTPAPTPNNPNTYYAFRYSNGTMTNLSTLGGPTSVGAAINDAGQVTGSSETTQHWMDRYGNKYYYDHAFLYSNGTMTDLGTLPGYLKSSGSGINNAGHVVGYSSDPVIEGNPSYRAFLYKDGAMSELGTLGGPTSSANDINDAGQVTGSASLPGNTGTHAYLYTNGTMTDLGTLEGHTFSSGYAINASGQVTGISSTYGSASPTYSHAFLYSGGLMTDLGTLGGKNSYPNDINASGQIVGRSEYSGGFFYHAFLYSDGSMIDLNSLLPPGSPWLFLEGARGINDAGQIVGYGRMLFNGVEQRRAFLMTPVPLPSAAWLLASGFLGLIGSTWRGTQKRLARRHPLSR